MLIADHRLVDAADGSNTGPQGLRAHTRDRVRQTIADDGPITAVALASRLGLTTPAVRRHLDLLAEEGAMEERQLSNAGGSGRCRGRPTRAYILSEAGHAGMDSDYDDVATSALRFSRRAGQRRMPVYTALLRGGACRPARVRLVPFGVRQRGGPESCGTSAAAR